MFSWDRFNFSAIPANGCDAGSTILFMLLRRDEQHQPLSVKELGFVPERPAISSRVSWREGKRGIMHFAFCAASRTRGASRLSCAVSRILSNGY